MSDAKMELQVVPKTPPPLPEKISDLSDIQRGWLQLSHRRNYTFYELTKDELKVQEILSGITKETKLDIIQSKISEASKLIEESKEKRLFFTNNLQERLIKPLMEFEKRNVDLLDSTKNIEREARIEANRIAALAAAKETEVKMYKAHILNEYERTSLEYRQQLESRILFYYHLSLKKKKMNKAEMNEEMTMIKNELTQIEVPKAVKFTRVHVTNTEAKAIIDTIVAPDNSALLAEITATIPTVYAMYQEDFKNAEAAIEAQNIAIQKKKAEENKQLAQSAAMANVIASAEPVVVSTPGGAKTTVKKKWVIDEENTAEWATSVMTHFLANLPLCQQKLLVKAWPKLTLSQMAAALSKVANDSTPVKQFSGLKMSEEIK